MKKKSESRPIRRPPTVKDMEFIVEHRGRIQKGLLLLWKFGNKRLSTLKHPESTVFHLLIGAAFSLWRAIFLIEGLRSETTMNDHALRFLDNLTWHNAINYAQDQDARDWTVGYYLNNAYARLSSARRLLRLKGEENEIFDKVRKFLNVQNSTGEQILDTRQAWLDAYIAVRTGYRILVSRRIQVTSK